MNAKVMFDRPITVNIWWWLIHMMPMVRKLITYATRAGHCARSASHSAVLGAGRLMPSTSSVMAMAKTPSAKVSRRPVVTLAA